MSTLSLENVTYTYKNAQRAAVSGISCKFEEGKVYAIVGPSGSGKSTLLSLLAGLDLPTEGEVAFDGDSLAGLNLDRYRRESISMIFQAFHLFPLMTVMENVCFPMELCGVTPKDAKPRASALLEGVGITKEQMGRFPSKLSGGERQRVAIARAMIRKPELLLADEPTGSLDSYNAESVFDIMKQIAKEGTLVLMVTHDRGLAGQCEELFEMEKAGGIGICAKVHREG